MNNKKQSHLSKAPRDPEPEYKPKTCATSRRMLEKKDPKKELGELTYHDYLIQRGKMYKEKN